MLRRLLPRSLQGQMLLAVALAVLVAQVLSAVLLYRADQQRREAAVVNALAFQLVAGPRPERRAEADRADQPRRRGDRRRGSRLERAQISPLRTGDTREPRREALLQEVLVSQGMQVGELVVLSREIGNDRLARRFLRHRARIRGRPFDDTGTILVAGLRREGTEQWLVARTPEPRPNRRAVGGLILQTALLYLVLVGGLAILLRRITRPLAVLTQRVQSFAGTLSSGEPPLEPTGPSDTRRLIAAHNAMEQRIAALLDEKDVMLGAIGHDLKTPLAALRVRIESVADEAERARMAASIEDITRSLDDILSLARVGRPTDPLERTDLAALVAAVVEEYEDMGEPVTLGETARIKLPVRATWLRRALRNLVGNALRYGGSAHVSLRQSGDRAVIAIADSGPGIKDGEIAAMLEPFTRGEASRNRATGGAGLGLTLARAIAEQHGGQLHLANRTGADGEANGLVAEIRLPLAR